MDSLFVKAFRQAKRELAAASTLTGVTNPHDRARLCMHLAILRRHAPAEADELVAALSHGSETLGERLTEVLKCLGVPEPGPRRGIPALPLKPMSSAEMYVCPVRPAGSGAAPAGAVGPGVCDRAVVRRAGVSAPQCALHGVALRIERL